MDKTEALETLILPALQSGGYSFRRQTEPQTTPNGLRQSVDVWAEGENNLRIPIALRWQQEPSDEEEEIVYEVISLIETAQANADDTPHAYLVLGGGGWRLRDFYIRQLESYLPHRDYVTILTLEDFVAKANQGEL